MAELFGAADGGGAGGIQAAASLPDCMEAEEIYVWPFLSHRSVCWCGVKRMRGVEIKKLDLWERRAMP